MMARRPAINFALVDLILAAHRFRSDLFAVRKAAFDGRNRAFRVRACAPAEAADLNTP
jgi:hypothetical protein